MKKIFVCYRHADSAASAERITERLTAYFGMDALLRRDLSVSAATPGPVAALPAPQEDAATAVERYMADCGLVVLVIGPDWLERTPSGRRIDDPKDVVRLEIETALRHGIPIVPALVQRASMPVPEQLPPSVRLLTEQESGRGRSGESLLRLVCGVGLPVRRDPDFRNDTLRLCEVIESLARLTPDDPQQGTRRLRDTMVSAVLALSAVMVIHGVALALLADRWLLAPGSSAQVALLTPRFWLGVASWAPLLDIALILTAAIYVGRRTGQFQAAFVAAVAVEMSAVLSGALAFGAVTWANWPDLSQPAGTSIALFNNNYGVALSFFVVGFPLGVAASLLLGLIGGGIGLSYFHTSQLRQLRRRRASWAIAPDAIPGGGIASAQAAPAKTRSERKAQKQAQKQAQQLVRAPRKRALAPGKVFISYRRDDSAVMCGSIYERLVEIFGPQAIFKDVDMIPIGANFQTYIESALQESRVQLVVIGPQWLDIRGADGRRRLDDSGDFVRFEIETALRLGLTVIPVLVQGATLPAAEDLPESLRPLVRNGALIVRVDPDFNADMWRLANIAWPVMQAPPAPPSAAHKRLTLPLPRGARSRAALAVSATLFTFALYGLGAGRIMSPIVATSRFLKPTQADLLTLGAPIIALSALCIGASALLALRSQRVLLPTIWTMTGNLIAFAVAMMIILINGGPLHHPLEKSATDQSTFVLSVIMLAILLYIVLLLPLLALSAIAARVGSRLPGALGVFSRRKLLVLGAPANAEDAQRVFAGLRKQFGGRVMSLASLLARAGDTPKENIERAVRRGAGVVALLGLGWSEIPGGQSEQPDSAERAAQPLDWVVAAALAARKSIIPVLLAGASIPPLDQLSPARRNLALLNAASVRGASDFPSDMRRLNTVIERAMRLRPAWRVTRAASVALLIAVLAIGAIAARGVYFNSALVLAYSHNDQTGPLGALAVAAALDITLYLLAGALVALCVGRVGSGIGAAFAAALAGNALAVGHLALLLHQHGAPVAALTSATLANVQSDGYAYDISIGVVELLVSVVLGWVGAYFGSVGYRGRMRSAQNRALYQAIGQEATLRQTASGSSASSPNVEAGGAASADDAEAARRSAIAAEMTQAYAQARRRALQRNGVAMSAAALLLIALLVLSSQVYQGLAHTNQGQANTIHVAHGAQTATANALVAKDFAQETVTEVAQETASVVVMSTQTAQAFFPYNAHAPGPCDTGSGQWGNDGPGATSCTAGGLDLAEPANQQVGFGETFTWPQHDPTDHFSTSVTITSLHSNTCAALITMEQSAAVGMLEFGVCSDGSWGLYQYDNASPNGAFLAGGGQQLTSAIRLEEIVNGSYIRFLINGVTKWGMTEHALSINNYIELFVYSLNTAKCEATFSDFNFTPLR